MMVYTIKFRQNWAVHSRWRRLNITADMAGSEGRLAKGNSRTREFQRLKGRQNTANIQTFIVVTSLAFCISRLEIYILYHNFIQNKY